jgi:hypothetical protein
MPNCSSLTKKREPCKHTGLPEYNGMCTLHHNAKLRNDEAYRTAFTARLAEAEAARAAREAALQAQREAAAAAAEASKRAERIVKRDRAIAAVPSLHLMKILDHAMRAMEIWSSNTIPGYDIPKAYAAILYRTPHTPEYTALLTAIVKLRYLGSGLHPDADIYRNVPQAEKDEVNAAITAALAPYLPIDPLTVIGEGDKMRPLIVERQRAERWAEIERHRAAAAAAAAQAEAARLAQFNEDLRLRPVVFERDPEGGINLRAFATDRQNIHRSSVQEGTHKMVLNIMKRPTLEDVEVLPEIVESFNDRRKITWRNADNLERVITEITHDYFNTMAFDTPYSDVVDRVWAFIRGHVYHKDLVRRLAEEMYEGIGMCSNGKMARLMNVLQGYDETLEVEAPKELFQARMGTLRKLPMEEREAAARALFAEFNIPEDQHEAWLDPLREDDDPAAAGAAAAVATH